MAYEENVSKLLKIGRSAARLNRDRSCEAVTYARNESFCRSFWLQSGMMAYKLAEKAPSWFTRILLPELQEMKAELKAMTERWML